MSVSEMRSAEFLSKRDVANFLQLRHARPGDDSVIGDLLVRSFRETYARKLPSIITSDERERELRDVCTRRQIGCVRVLELGYQVIGTYALLPAGSPLDDSWVEHCATLRCLAIDPKFHQLRLSDALLVDAIGLARAWKANSICLHVQAGAEGVARLYERHGFIRAPEGDKVSNGYAIEGYLLKFNVQEHVLGA